MSSSSSSSSSSDVSMVSVRFVTRVPSLPVVPDTFIQLPTQLARYGLSEIVNHLASIDPPRPFDFLINGEFLRSDLAKYLQQKQITGESGLTLEYIEALPEPESLPSNPHPDWVSSISSITQANDVSPSATVAACVSGCYDASVKVWNIAVGKESNNLPIASAKLHTSAVKSVSVFKSSVKWNDASQQLSSFSFISASKDKTLRLWNFNQTDNHPTLNCIGLCEGHLGSVETVASVDAEGGKDAYKFASASWDGIVHLWDARKIINKKSDEDDSKNKKRKTEAGSVDSSSSSISNLSPLCTLSGHVGAVTSVVYPHSNAIYSGGYDHSIIQWDVTTQQPANSWTGNKVISSLSYSTPANLLASGHHDKIIRIWDPRKQDKEVIRYTLRSHLGWVSGVSFSPSNPHQLVSSSYDNSIKVWDLRSSLPLHTVKAHDDKALCVEWAADEIVLSGGADKQLRACKVRRGAAVSEDK